MKKIDKFTKIELSKILLIVLSLVSVFYIFKYQESANENDELLSQYDLLFESKISEENGSTDEIQSVKMFYESLNSEYKADLLKLHNELDILEEEKSTISKELLLAQSAIYENENFIDSITNSDEEILTPRITGTINGTKVIPVLTQLVSEQTISDIYNVVMLKELEHSIIFSYYRNFDTLIVGELHKKDLSLINEIFIPLESNDLGIKTIAKVVDNGIAILKVDSIDLYSFEFELTSSISLPVIMLNHYSNQRTRALDGRENINLYDVSNDLKELTYCDKSGVYLYNLLSKQEIRIMEPRESSFIDESGATVTYNTVHLHPKFYHGFVISEIHDFYAGYLRFHLYDLENKKHTFKEISGTQYGYLEAQGPNFSIYASTNFNEEYFPNEIDYYNHTFIYNPISDELMHHPISQDWIICASEQWGYDGVNGSTYFVTPRGIKDYEGDLETKELISYYFDYTSQTYIDKHIVINTDIEINNSPPANGYRQPNNIIGTLEDNTAIYLILDHNKYYLFRF